MYSCSSAESLSTLFLQSEHFKTTSQKVARKFWWKNVKMIVLICVIVFIIILFIVLFATGAIP